MGYRTAGGFVGEHDRLTGEPIPDHISARWQDLESLMTGLLQTTTYLEASAFHPVLTAAKVAFGFVFIHPLVDGNGRLHRYLMHHLLASMRFTPRELSSRYRPPFWSISRTTGVYWKATRTRCWSLFRGARLPTTT
nr:Fic family protein [Hymenobacter defluvii]